MRVLAAGMMVVAMLALAASAAPRVAAQPVARESASVTATPLAPGAFVRNRHLATELYVFSASIASTAALIGLYGLLRTSGDVGLIDAYMAQISSPMLGGISLAILAVGIGVDIGSAVWASDRDLARRHASTAVSVLYAAGLGAMVAGGVIALGVGVANPRSSASDRGLVLAGYLGAVGVTTLGWIAMFVGIGLDISLGARAGAILSIAPTSDGVALGTRGHF